MATGLAVVPVVKRARLGRGVFEVGTGLTLNLGPGCGAEDVDALEQLQQDLDQRHGVKGAIDRVARPGQARPPYVLLCEASPRRLGAEGYTIDITPDGATVRGATAAGRFYAVQTLRQVLRASGLRWPTAHIEDWPDFELRGVCHDVCRGKVPTLQTLCDLVDALSFMKVNALTLYVEHTFFFKSHPLIGRGCDPLRPEDILRLQAHCRRRHVELIPCLQSFGHMAHVLKLRPYRHLAESKQGWTLCPTDRGTYRLLADLYGDFLPLFDSGRFNVCADETYDLGKGRTRGLAEKAGVGRVYLDHILQLRKLAARHGKQLMFWGDIVLQHPELIREIPRDVVLLNWFYEGGDRRHVEQTCRAFARCGLPMIVCPGTSGWNTLFARTDLAMANIREFARAGKRHGAIGLLNTDWGDGGHRNLLAGSWHGFAYGAEQSWAPGAAHDGDFDRRVSIQLFDDPTGRVGAALRRLGQTYTECAIPAGNSSALVRVLFDDLMDGKDIVQARAAAMKRVIRSADRVERVWHEYRPRTNRQRLDRDELLLASAQVRHAAERALASIRVRRALASPGAPRSERDALRAELSRLARRQRSHARTFARVWGRRNRRSNLADNLRLYRQATACYGRAARALRAGTAR